MLRVADVGSGPSGCYAWTRDLPGDPPAALGASSGRGAVKLPDWPSLLDAAHGRQGRGEL